MQRLEFSVPKLEMSFYEMCYNEHKMFHGIKTEAEAYNICKAEMEQSGKPQVSIWFLIDTQDEFSSRIMSYRRYSEVPFEIRTLSGQRGWSWSIFHSDFYPDFVERRNPIPLIELARARIIQNCCNYYYYYNCNLTNVIEKIDELQIPAMEKEELKKLFRCDRSTFHNLN